MPDDIAAAQQAVLAAQQQVDAARNHASAALASATSVCAAIGVDPTDPAGAVAAINACQTALQDVATAQTAVNDAQTALATASTTLDDLLDQLANQPPPTTTPPTTPHRAADRPPRRRPPTTTTPEPTTTPPTTAPPPARPATEPAPPDRPDRRRRPHVGPARHADDDDAGGRCRAGGSGAAVAAQRRRRPVSRSSSGVGSASAAKPSAADLVAYQSAVDAATANVTVAQQALAQATVVSPIDGTVVAVNLRPGTTASAGSTTQTIVVVEGAGGFEATTTVSLDRRAQREGGPGGHRDRRRGVDAGRRARSCRSRRCRPAPTSTNYRVVIAPAGRRHRAAERRHRLGRPS